MRRMSILLVVTSGACSDPPAQAFVVDGFVDVAPNPNASVIGLWEIPTSPPRSYKHGDGVRLDARFTLGFETDPPPAALGPAGIGVAYVVMLPELTTIPDGPVNADALGILGISGDTAIVYKAGEAADGPAWSAELPPRFSCVQCIRDASGTGLDRFERIACASVLVEGPATPRCRWF